MEDTKEEVAFFSGALKDAGSFVCTNTVCLKKKFLLRHQFGGHFASGVFGISCGNCIINRHICKRETTDTPGKASWL